MSLLRRLEKTLDQRLRAIFGASANRPGAREAIELYRDALDQVAQRASAGKRGERLFPFDRVTVELLALDAERKAVLEAVFEPKQMGDDIRAALVEERVTAPPTLTVSVHYPEDAPVEMRVLCEKSAQPTTENRRVELIPVRLQTLTGVASEQDFAVTQPRINMGRENDVADSIGRVIRRNDLFFVEGDHAANASVSRSHAHLGFDDISGDWRLFDDGSSLGTSIYREGNRIAVPAHASRGVLLRPGDEIYLGQVRLRIVPE